MPQDQDVPPPGSGLRPSGLSQSSLSQAKPLVPNAIWSDKLDGIYDVEVTRLDENRGRLTVSIGGNLLREASVRLSYGAEFGPDIGDIADWQDCASDMVDWMLATQGIEAGTATTEGRGPKDESPVAKPCAQEEPPLV